jgi:hypothetical protein
MPVELRIAPRDPSSTPVGSVSARVPRLKYLAVRAARMPGRGPTPLSLRNERSGVYRLVGGRRADGRRPIPQPLSRCGYGPGKGCLPQTYRLPTRHPAGAVASSRYQPRRPRRFAHQARPWASRKGPSQVTPTPRRRGADRLSSPPGRPWPGRLRRGRTEAVASTGRAGLPRADSLVVGRGQGLGDDPALDLRSPLEDGPDLGIPPVPLHGVVADVPVATVDLDSLL